MPVLNAVIWIGSRSSTSASGALSLFFGGNQLDIKKFQLIAFLKSDDVLVGGCNSARRVFVRTEANYGCFAPSIFCDDWASDQHFLTKLKPGHEGPPSSKSDHRHQGACIAISKTGGIIQNDLCVLGYKIHGNISSKRVFYKLNLRKIHRLPLGEGRVRVSNLSKS